MLLFIASSHRRRLAAGECDSDTASVDRSFWFGAAKIGKVGQVYVFRTQKKTIGIEAKFVLPVSFITPIQEVPENNTVVNGFFL